MDMIVKKSLKKIHYRTKGTIDYPFCGPRGKGNSEYVTVRDPYQVTCISCLTMISASERDDKLLDQIRKQREAREKMLVDREVRSRDWNMSFDERFERWKSKNLLL